MTGLKHVLLIGGTGVFGERLAKHLMGFHDIRLTVTSRSLRKADALAERLRAINSEVQVSGAALNTNHDLAGQLNALTPWAVVDCSGPFQGAGYDTAQAVLDAGAHMIDLADARSYLLGYHEALDDLAKEKGVIGIAGASSTPALSCAVVAELARGFEKIEDVIIAITPGGKGDVGEAVIGAILTYVGKAVPVWKDGTLGHVFGWLKTKKLHIPKLGARRVAPVETADAELLGPAFNVRGRVEFFAGLESPLEQRGVQLLAFLRHYNLFPDPRFLTPLLAKARNVTRIGMTDRGGMSVTVKGVNEAGKIGTKRWSLLAEDNDGPCVPIMAAAAALKALQGDALPVGADVALGRLKLADIEQQMGGYAIKTQIEDV